ncbi:MAG: glycosyltransferase family 2 protein [Planctomycetes bacterium]|nr:glycosyltransferase family 2 protein [Planctomycetota bacterium]
MVDNKLPENIVSDNLENAVSISVFFPCYNEFANIKPLVIKSLSTIERISSDFELILVDDGSVDGTSKLIDDLAAKYAEVKAIHHTANSGYGAALQTGFRAASKDLVFYTDGDAQFNIADLPDILPLIQRCDIVSCFRINRQEGPLRKLNAWCWGRLVCFLFGLHLRDVDCAFKLYKREIFDNIRMKSTGALIDAEILARASKKGYTIMQAGVRHYPRTAGAQTGANIKVVARAFIELFKLFREIRKEK